MWGTQNPENSSLGAPVPLECPCSTSGLARGDLSPPCPTSGLIAHPHHDSGLGAGDPEEYRPSTEHTATLGAPWGHGVGEGATWMEGPGTTGKERGPGQELQGQAPGRDAPPTQMGDGSPTGRPCSARLLSLHSGAKATTQPLFS